MAPLLGIHFAMDFTNLCMTRISTTIKVFSDNLQMPDVKHTSVRFSYLFLETFLSNGVMFPSFHSKGTTVSFNDIFVSNCTFLK